MARRKRGGYRMTPKRRAALKKAQIASARNRKGLSKKKKVAIGLGVATLAAVTYHKASGSALTVKRHKNETILGNKFPAGISRAHTPGGIGVRRTFGTRAVSVQWTHRANRTMQGVKATSRNRNATMTQQQRDEIPFYEALNAKGQPSASWARGNSKKIADRNRKLREQGIIK